MKSVSNEVLDRVMTNVHNKVEIIPYQVWSQASSHILDQVNYNVRKHLYNQLWDQVRIQIRKHLYNQLWDQVHNRLSNQA
jgi:ABC-type phosphate transport system ATPase subunit